MATLKPQHAHDGEYGHGGHYPRDAYSWEGMPDRDRWADMLPVLTRSPAVEDRVLAHVILNELRATLPMAYLVVEAKDSPNLQEPRRVHPWTPLSNVWSAHVLLEDAEAWRDSYQARCDRYVGAHPWWGPSAHRKFEVIRAEGAYVSYLRQPGADPARHNTAFSR